MSSLNSARVKSRDAKRKADLKQIEIALELHYDKHGAYTYVENKCGDYSIGTGSDGCTTGSGNDWDSDSDLRDLITDGFLKTLPKDPLNNSSYHYIYEPFNTDQLYPGSPPCQQYDLCAYLESGGTFCISKR